MKVCMIAYAQYGPDARIKSYVKTIQRAGGSVDLFVLREAGKGDAEEDGNVRLYYLVSKYQGTQSILYVLSYVLFFLKSLWKVSSMAFRRRYHAVHVHNMPNFIIFAAVMAKMLGARLLLDVHDLMPVNYMVKFGVADTHPLIRLLVCEQKLSARIASHILCADHMQKRYLEDVCRIPADKIMVIMNLPDEEAFRKRVPPKEDGKFHVIYHGTVAKRLGIDVLLQTIAKIADEIPVRLSIYGTGDYLPEALRLSDSLGLNGKVFFSKSYFPAEQISEMVSGMDIGIVGNRRSLATEQFMMPVKLLEYVYLGIPVVAPRLPIIQSYFDEEMLAYYEPENVDDMARAIVELYRSPETRTLLAQKAAQFYNGHSWSVQAQQYMTLLSA
jgi:glycosyltransferase involved in cell wall biosynthesis